MVFSFGRRLQTAAYLRDSLVEGVRQQELKPLLQELHEQAMGGPLDASKQPPPEFGNVQQLWNQGVWVDYGSRLSRSIDEESEPEKAKRLEALKECRAWEIEERERYAKLREAKEQEA
jgi:hypothetical protein